MIKNKNLNIIGGGNLGVAIAEGLLESRLIDAKNITVTRRNIHKISHLADKGVQITADNQKAVKRAHIIILAIKPYQIKEVLTQIKTSLDVDNQILVSVVTGVSLEDIQKIIGNKIALLRAMPNTAIAIKESMTCITTKNANDEQVAHIKAIFDLLGKTVVIEENLMAAATVLGACGIAYAMRFIRAQSQGGIEIGFNADIAQIIAAQTVKGAASLLLEKGTHPEFEIDKVTTPQGCTIAGLNQMEHHGFSSSLIKGISTSYEKIAEIANEFD